MRFKDRVILVTGSTSGIGKVTARKLYDEGATVILSGHHLDKSALSDFIEKDRVRFIVADITKRSDLNDLKNSIMKEFGKLDHLVANAGVLPKPASIIDITDENIDKTVDTNLKGTFQSLRVFGELIQRTSDHGSIVTLSSVDGIIGEPFGVIYSGTKAAIISFTKSFARHFNSPLVRVNAVAPGLIDTPLTASTGEDPSLTTGLSIIPRIGTSEEVANAICFLLSDEASFITGQVLAVDGGFTLK